MSGTRRRIWSRLDRYISGMFLKTFFTMIGVFCVIAVVFDLMENIGDLLSNGAPLGETLLYYLSFCFHFGNLLSGFIVFLTIIWFTSRLAQRTEIVAMLSGGMGFTRLMRPYFVAATVLVALSLVVAHWILPQANARKVDFEFQYIHQDFHISDQHLYREVVPGTIDYFRSVSVDRATGYRFQHEQWGANNRLVQRIIAAKATWIPEDSTWRLINARVRDFQPDGSEKLRYLTRLDTALTMRLEDFGSRAELTSTMKTSRLGEHIEDVRSKGIPVAQLLLEKYGRTTNAFAIYVLTLLGVGIASRKQRGGMGMHLFAAVLIGFTYVFTSKLITVYAASAVLPEWFPISRDGWLMWASWAPNLLFALLGLGIYVRAPK